LEITQTDRFCFLDTDLYGFVFATKRHKKHKEELAADFAVLGTPPQDALRHYGKHAEFLASLVFRLKPDLRPRQRFSSMQARPDRHKERICGKIMPSSTNGLADEGI
jgi:hypothetical protein